jgi:carbon storage regulator
MLVITRKLNESIVISGGSAGSESVEISVLELGKDKVKFGVKAPRDVKIMRSELVAAKSENVEAATVAPISKEALAALSKFKK